MGSADVGSAISLLVNFTDLEGASESVTSTATASVSAASSPPPPPPPPPPTDPDPEPEPVEDVFETEPESNPEEDILLDAEPELLPIEQPDVTPEPEGPVSPDTEVEDVAPTEPGSWCRMMSHRTSKLAHFDDREGADDFVIIDPSGTTLDEEAAPDEPADELEDTDPRIEAEITEPVIQVTETPVAYRASTPTRRCNRHHFPTG